MKKSYKGFNFINIKSKEGELIKEALDIAISFLKKRYDIMKNLPPKLLDIEFCNEKYSNAYFYGYEYKNPKIIITKESSIWTTYKFKIGYHKYVTYAKVSKKTGYALQFIHELTHYIQYLEERRYSEMETTKNEIEYIEKHEPKYIKFIRTRQKRKNESL